MALDHQILIVEVDPKERVALRKLVEERGYHATTARDGNDAQKKLLNDEFPLVIANYVIPGFSSRKFLDCVKSHNEQTEVIYISDHVSVESAVEAMRFGAMDFICRPIDTDQLIELVKKSFTRNGKSVGRGPNSISATKIVAQDQSMRRLMDLAKQIADSRASVLIEGESGTGKELFARYLHEHSQRCQSPFIAVNCGALPETLLESELFGHEKGAFTGAISQKPGKFELADRSTLLLDEITEMQFHLQAKLLRVLQEKEIDRVGGRHPVSVDVRIIATTNRNIRKAIEKGEFRSDLFYRLNVIPFKIPPLRDRHEDIPVLAQHFVEKYNQIDGRNVKSLATSALNQLLQHPFPGNVRELENIIERAVLLCNGEMIQPEDLFIDHTLLETPSDITQDFEFAQNLMSFPLKEVEKKLIFHTLDKTNGNRTHAAKMLGISVRTLRNKLNEYKEKMDALEPG